MNMVQINVFVIFIHTYVTEEATKKVGRCLDILEPFSIEGALLLTGPPS